ncbi:unnamed protein product [Phaedon cochleariae]|uniref:Ankyrin repeat protein n=1 Tax=Phaedon cochleariae TaxID=80249 RepID=A0A9N9SFJ3_PHACE|nr:unnamed protein product [Phaedon cochleariae]
MSYHMDEKKYALHKAVQSRNIRKIKILLSQTEDINAKDENGETVLLIASEHERHDDYDSVMELLLSHEKIDPTVTNQHACNVLHNLAYKGNITWIKKILEKFPNMNVDEEKDDLNTPLTLAAKNNQLDVIKYLHSKGADINHENKKKFTALVYAASDGYEELTKELLELGADVDHRDGYGFTPLIRAAGWGYTRICEILLGYHANINTISNRGQTALTRSIRAGAVETVKLLLENHADPNYVNAYEIDKCFTPLTSASHLKNVEIMELLIEYGAEVNYPKPSYSLPLSICIKHGFTRGVEVLLAAGVHVADSALRSAQQYGRHDIIELLESHRKN